MRTAWLTLSLALVLSAEAQSPLQSAFTAEDVDWANTTEFPVNPNVKGFAASREDQILRCVGVLSPGAPHGGWLPGPTTNENASCCRLAFRKPIRLGTVIAGTTAGLLTAVVPPVALAILRPDAPFPGDVANDAHWIRLEPLRSGSGPQMFVLPPDTSTRAVRIQPGAVALRFCAGRLFDLEQAAATFASAGDARVLPQGDAWFVNAAVEINAAHPQWLIYAWDEPQSLRGLALFHPSFGHYQIAVFTGGAGQDPVAATDDHWKLITEADIQPPWRGADARYVDLGADISTTAVRVRVTRPFVNENPDITTWTGGAAKTCALSGLLVLADLGANPLPGRVALPVGETHVPIPIRFTLKQPGDVTLVIEDAAGRRVKNLISDTPFPAGDNVVWWDGLDESQMRMIHIPGVAMYYEIRGSLVKPGAYRVRGLYRQPVELRYEFSVYSGDNHPAWRTPDGRGGWLADHSPPSAVLFLPGAKPQVLISSFVAEAGEGLVWTDLTGKRTNGVRGIGGGGGWWGADYLARDDGDKPLPGIVAYNGGAWEDFLELWAMGTNQELLTYKFPDKSKCALGGLAARNGQLVASLTAMNQLLFADAATGKVSGTAPLADPRGLVFEPGGTLLALSGQQLVRLVLPDLKSSVLVADLADPHGIALDSAGNIYVSDWGNSHQVKVFAPDGKFRQAIGNAGAAKVGKYDSLHMNNPKGLTITPDGRLWVAECSHEPKRVSVWTLAGKFVKAMYGPAWYGGGGAIDPQDKSRFNIGQRGGLEFKLDWRHGASRLRYITYLSTQAGVPVTGGDWGASPQTPVYARGRRYLTNCYANGPTNGESVGALWQERDGIAVLVAAVGDANSWPPLKTAAFQSLPVPTGEPTTFAWSDINEDGQVQPAEVALRKDSPGCITIQHDLSFTLSSALHLVPRTFTRRGVPVYDLANAPQLVPGARNPGTSGGGQVIAGRDGWTVLTWPPAPLPNGSLLTGAKNGQVRWTYPVEFLGLHNSMMSPVPQSPGDVIGTTRLLGLTVTPRGTREELWAINGNFGVVYLFTTDGLHVATLFKDCRVTRKPWPNADPRGLLVNDFSLNQECFFPTINQTADGKIYLVVGQPTSNIIRVDGLESIRRLPDREITVTVEQLAAAAALFNQREQERIRNQGEQTLTVPIRVTAPVLDGQLDDWPTAYFVPLDKNTSAAVAVAGDRLYAAFQTHDGNLLANVGGIWQQLFKTGGALDLMLGTNPTADPRRAQPVAGDLRLLVTQVQGKTAAVLYRAVVPGTKEPVAFTSWHTIHLDEVRDISDAVQLAGTSDHYEFSVPLAALGLKPAPGLTIQGDIGILRGNGAQTIQRLDWHNKATGIVSDVPTEATLTPALWGRWRFVGQ